MNEDTKNEKLCKKLSSGVNYYLVQKGFNPKYYGFIYISDIICYYLLTNQSTQVLYKTAYKELANKYNKTLSSINRCVKFAVDSNKEKFNGMFNGKFSVKCCLQYLVMDIKNYAGIKAILN